ncbi:calcium-binding protein, partial [Caulobacter sp. Root1472]|uniref:calcium-binding protein n=1 Tax=Caulobacter sp. Root1472 TaxID=1736470 RepID=UPI00350F5865
MWASGVGPTEGADHFVGGPENDVVHAAGGDDLLEGGTGNDDLYGEGGNDHLVGGDGSDYMRGGQGDDLMEGGVGNDGFLSDYYGDDRMYGGDGDDAFTIWNSESLPRTVLVEGGLGDDRAYLNFTGDVQATINLGQGDDRLELYGGIWLTQSPHLVADLGDGDDIVLIEVDVSDTALPNATLTLGSGRDFVRFDFREQGPDPQVSTSSPYVITDFETGASGDRIDLYQVLMFARNNGLAADAWDGATNPFTSGYAQLRQDGADTVVDVDLDGAGGGEGWRSVLRLQNVTSSALTVENFRGMSPSGAIVGETLTYPDSEYMQGTIGDDIILVTSADVPDGGYVGFEGRAGNDLMTAQGIAVGFSGGLGDDHLIGGSNIGPAGLTGSALYGDGGNDRLEGSLAVDHLHGGDGDDILTGGDGDDLLDGGAGNDTIDGGAGFDSFSYADLASGVTVVVGAGTIASGAGGVDTLFGVEALEGTAYDDSLAISLSNTAGYTLNGGAGNDALTGGGGDDILVGGDGDDQLVGRGGNDTVSYTDGFAVTVNLQLTGAQNTGGAGVDTLSGIRNLIGSWFGDTLIGDGQVNVIHGDAFSIYGPAVGSDLIIAGGGGDTVYAEGGDDRVFGQDGDDYLSGGAGHDSLAGEVGNDTLYGEDGFDLLLGGDGADLLVGGVNDDRLYGDAGDDRLFGQGDNDLLEGGDGNDSLSGEDGADSLSGGAGQDLLLGGAGNDLLTGGINADRLRGDAGDDWLLGQDGDDWLDGGAGADSLNGEAGSDSLNGGDGSDLLLGGADTDRLFGDAGDDSLFGQDGDDILEGGIGA